MSTQTQFSDDHKPIGDKKISLALARLRVTRWLDALTTIPVLKENPGLMPRAIFIDLEDINELIKTYPEKDLKGIRVYFGLAGETEPRPGNTFDIRGMVVPVLKKENGRTADLIIESVSDNPNDTSIYDFTAPCPVFCDKQSELYVPYEPQK